jgi:hypothetical protein
MGASPYNIYSSDYIHPNEAGGKKIASMVISKIKEIYGKVARGCIALQDKVGNYTADRMSIYKEKEEEIKGLLSEMPSAERIKEMLSLCKMDISEFYSVYGKEKIETALRYSKDLKDRYTVLWLYYDYFGSEES